MVDQWSPVSFENTFNIFNREKKHTQHFDLEIMINIAENENNNNDNIVRIHSISLD